MGVSVCVGFNTMKVGVGVKVDVGPDVTVGGNVGRGSAGVEVGDGCAGPSVGPIIINALALLFNRNEDVATIARMTSPVPINNP